MGKYSKKSIIEALSKINPKKPFGTNLFNSVARISVNVGFEAVCLRLNPKNKKIEVLLTKRLVNDSYPGQWHVPGSIMRPGETEKNVFTRLEKKELGKKIVSRHYVGLHNNIKAERGHFISLIYSCVLGKGSPKGTWYAVDNLPKDIIKHHEKYLIPPVVKFFLKKNVTY